MLLPLLTLENYPTACAHRMSTACSPVHLEHLMMWLYMQVNSGSPGNTLDTCAMHTGAHAHCSQWKLLHLGVQDMHKSSFALRATDVILNMSWCKRQRLFRCAF